MKERQGWFDRADVAALIIAGLYMAFQLYRISFGPNVWHDEVVHMNAGWHVMTEGLPWSDIYQNKVQRGVLFYAMPLPWYIIGIFGRVFGISVFSVRVLYAAFSVVILAGPYGLARTIFNRSVALIALLILSCNYIFFLGSRQVMPQVPSTMFGVLALFLF